MDSKGIESRAGVFDAVILPHMERRLARIRKQKQQTADLLAALCKQEAALVTKIYVARNKRVGEG